jgi:spore coat polysaccharide biosynthesis predicted glycosyltransferase SpsG
LGHFSRASRIAAALKAQLHAAVQIYVVASQGQNGVPDFGMAKRISSLPPLKEQILNDRDTLDLFVVDVPPNQVTHDLKDCLATARTGGASLISIDNIELGSCVDLVFLPGFRRPDIEANAMRHGRLVYGWDCFLLDELAGPIHWQPGERVLVLTGGSDATNLGRHWPALLEASLPESTELHWVTGPFAQAPVWPQTQRIQMTQHLAPNGLQPLMSTTNYAVTVYGVSFFELLQHGVPTVVFSPYGDKDDLELREIEQEGLALVAKDEVDATEKLIALMGNEELAARLSAAAAEKLSSRGIDRLCSEVKMLLST